MLIILASLLTLVAFVVLFRLLWQSAGPGRYSTLITVAAATLVLGLGILAATGRLHWLVAIGAALLPFLRRGIGLLRYVPLLGSLLGTLRQTRAGAASGAGSGNRGSGSRTSHGSMSRAEALEVLGLGTQATRDEIVAAHRRLIQKLHPDRGGSNYLAQQLNEAKRILLQKM